MSKISGKICGLVIVGGYERKAMWIRSAKKRRVEFTDAGPLLVYAKTKRKAVRAAHKARVRAVKPRGSILIGIVGGWQRLARYQFKHGLPI